MSIEVAIREFTLWSDYYKNIENMKEAVDHQQIANWLQELKERREMESRKIPQDMTAVSILRKYRQEILDQISKDGEIYREEFSKAYDHAISVLEGKEASE